MLWWTDLGLQKHNYLSCSESTLKQHPKGPRAQEIVELQGLKKTNKIKFRKVNQHDAMWFNRWPIGLCVCHKPLFCIANQRYANVGNTGCLLTKLSVGPSLVLCAFPLFQPCIYTGFTFLYFFLLNTETALILLSFISFCPTFSTIHFPPFWPF